MIKLKGLDLSECSVFGLGKSRVNNRILLTKVDGNLTVKHSLQTERLLLIFERITLTLISMDAP